MFNILPPSLSIKALRFWFMFIDFWQAESCTFNEDIDKLGISATKHDRNVVVEGKQWKCDGGEETQ